MHKIRTYNYYFIFLLVLVSYIVIAQVEWMPASATVSFTIKNAGLTVNGSFGSFSGKLFFDMGALAGASLNGSVDMAPINKRIDPGDEHQEKVAYLMLRIL